MSFAAYKKTVQTLAQIKKISEDQAAKIILKTVAEFEKNIKNWRK